MLSSDTEVFSLDASWSSSGTGWFSSDAASSDYTGEHPGDHNHQDFPTSIALQMGGEVRYKWEAYCDTNGRSTDTISLSSERRGTESTAIQIGGVLQCELEAYCDTF